MQFPPHETEPNFHQLDNQDRTQVTVGGSPIAGEFSPGKIVGETYEVLSLIGSGGMGHVYHVRHTIMGQDYALKTLGAEHVTEAAWRRFQNEAQAIARMNHPNIVGIYNLGLHEGTLPFYVMDLIKGQTLSDLLRRTGSLSWQDALRIFSEAASGFGYAHKKGIVHRDIKPPNILILDQQSNSGRVKIVDFGIAKLSGIKDKANQQLTSVGELCGSPYYMSPEQCNGSRVDARSDIYSFGCALFETLTGSPPFRGRNAIETMLLHQTAAPPSLRSVTGRQFPPMLEKAVAAMLEKAPMDRYQSMELIIQDFAAILEGRDQAINPYSSHIRSHTDLSSTSRMLPEVDIESAEHSHTPASWLKKIAIGSALTMAIGLPAVAGCLYWQNSLKGGATNKTVSGITANHKIELQTPSDLAKAERPDINEKMIPATPTQMAGKSMYETAPYSKLITKDGKKWRVFDFPVDFLIGSVRTDEIGKVIKASGHLEFPVDTSIDFLPDPSLASYPNYMTRFQPGDIDTISLGPETNNAILLKAVCQIEGVRRLRTHACDELTEECVEFLKKLKDLKVLELNYTSINGKQLAKLPALRQLEELQFNGCDGADDLCKALEGSTKLKLLHLDHAKLGQSGFKSISTMVNLRELLINGVSTNDQDLKYLASLKHLKALSAIRCDINYNQGPILETFPALDELEIGCTFMPRREVKALKKALPMVKIR